MPEGKDTEPKPAGVFLFTILVLVVHVIDFLFVRRAGFVDWYVLVLVALVYNFLAFLAQGIMKDHTIEPYAWFNGMWLMPFLVSLLGSAVGPTSAIGAIIGKLAVFFPLFIFYIYRKGQLNRLLTAYFLLWLFGALFMHLDAIETYANQQGIEITYNPVLTYEYLLNWTWETLKNLFQLVFVRPIERISREGLEALAAAKGDYYTGQVDQAAQKRLGVYLENFRPSEAAFYENIPVTAYATMKAETLDIPLDITITCAAAPQTVAIGASAEPVPASRIVPRNTFTVLTSDQYDIDCVWEKGLLRKGMHQLKMRAEFDFTTRAYLKSYMMDRERLREYRRLNVDPLADVPDRTPVATYTSGPVRIGMGLGAQPIALGQQGETLPPWGVTIQNAWEGSILQITGLTFLVPEGIRISDASTIGAVETTCGALPPEEQPACDETLVNVYTLAPEALASDPTYMNLTIKNIRMYLKVENPDKVLGKTPIAVQNFKVSIRYRYALERGTLVSVKEAAA
jgi:hypothetical protein